MERKEAIELVKNHLTHSSFKMLHEALETLIPELAEPEDERGERIRKEIIQYIKDINKTGNLESKYSTNWIGWLETQSGQMINKIEKQHLAVSIANYLNTIRVEGCMDLSSMEYKDIEDAVVNSDWGRVYHYMKKILEDQGESDYNPYKATVKSIITMTERYANGNDLRDFYDNVKVKCKEAVDYDNIWLEKTSRQESTANLEPRFKVGDWVTADYSFLRSPVKIVDASNTVYRIEDIEGCSSGVDIDYLDRHYHLWTIQDAEDGDILFVLSAENFDSRLIIFSGINSDNKIKYHFRILNNKYPINDGLTESDHKCFVPATKAQRDVLFQKMGEFGYIWDDQTKMLSRINSK